MYADHVRFHSCRPYIRASTDALIRHYVYYKHHSNSILSVVGTENVSLLYREVSSFQVLNFMSEMHIIYGERKVSLYRDVSSFQGWGFALKSQCFACYVL